MTRGRRVCRESSSFLTIPEEPYFLMHSDAGIAAPPFNVHRNKLGFDSFSRLHEEKRAQPWIRRRLPRLSAAAAAADAAAAAAAAESSSSLPPDSDSPHNSTLNAADLARRRALATFVLGVHPPPLRSGGC